MASGEQRHSLTLLQSEGALVATGRANGQRFDAMLSHRAALPGCRIECNGSREQRKRWKSERKLCVTVSSTVLTSQGSQVQSLPRPP